MAENFVLSKRDYDRLQDALRWFERNKNQTFYRRRGGIGGGGGLSVRWLTVIESLVYADPSSPDLPLGRSSYTVGTVETDLDAEGEFVVVGATVQVSKSIGFDYSENYTTFDLRECVPWFATGEVVPVVNIAGVNYILQMLQYTGAESVAWIIEDSETSAGRTAAVFK